ncbi:unnamed protein product [Amoebophrya sp. A25]|nr:unnamed protein product [Amoebophrya sp. A25]|eukprot:GSA25T00005519001.1
MVPPLEQSNGASDALLFDRLGKAVLKGGQSKHRHRLEDVMIFDRSAAVPNEVDCVFPFRSCDQQKSSPRVYIGTKEAAYSEKLLADLKITSIVNCLGASNSKNKFELRTNQFRYFRFDIASFPRLLLEHDKSGDSRSSSTNHNTTEAQEQLQEVLRFFRPLFDFVDEQLREGRNVLIHCLAGAHRAGATGVAYCMWRRSTMEAARLENSRKDSVDEETMIKQTRVDKVLLKEASVVIDAGVVEYNSEKSDHGVSLSDEGPRKRIRSFLLFTTLAEIQSIRPCVVPPERLMRLLELLEVAMEVGFTSRSSNTSKTMKSSRSSSSTTIPESENKNASLLLDTARGSSTTTTSTTHTGTNHKDHVDKKGSGGHGVQPRQTRSRTSMPTKPEDLSALRRILNKNITPTSRSRAILEGEDFSP